MNKPTIRYVAYCWVTLIRANAQLKLQCLNITIINIRKNKHNLKHFNQIKSRTVITKEFIKMYCLSSRLMIQKEDKLIYTHN